MYSPGVQIYRSIDTAGLGAYRTHALDTNTINTLGAVPKRFVQSPQRSMTRGRVCFLGLNINTHKLIGLHPFVFYLRDDVV